MAWNLFRRTRTRRPGRRPLLPRSFRPCFEPLEDRVVPTVFPVINTANSGAGSLRQAILDANAHPNDLDERDRIEFNIVGDGVQTIRPTSALPAVTDPVVIDGYSQPGTSMNTDPAGFNAVLAIELDGSLAGPLG